MLVRAADGIDRVVWDVETEPARVIVAVGLLNPGWIGARQARLDTLRAQAAGAAIVSETLAQYSSMMVLEKSYGTKMARDFYDYHMAEYFRGRTVYTNRETPLLDVISAPYLHYFKGGLVMYTLRDRLGDAAVNGALRRFREKYAGANAPPATSRALYAELQAITPDSLEPLLSDLFEHITLWGLRADSARAKPVDDGAYRVTLYIDANKARADSVGNQTPIEMDDLVEIGVFGPPAQGMSDPEPLDLKQHRIRSGKQTIEVMVTVAASPELDARGAAVSAQTVAEAAPVIVKAAVGQAASQFRRPSLNGR